jgi:hypothetical protein
MALFVQQNDNRSKLQERLAAELQEKARIRAQEDAGRPDGVEDSQYLKGTKQTTSLAWLWVVVVIFAVVATTFLIVVSIN